MRAINLQIFLGYKCNMTCRHCLNDSGPGSKKPSLSQIEEQNLITQILVNQKIKVVNFSGGEPMLYLPTIERIVNLVRAALPRNRQVKFCMTSNGALTTRFKNELANLNLDCFLISYDQYHREFLPPEEIAIQINTLASFCKEIEINAVIEQTSELNIITELALTSGIKVNLSSPVVSGRQTSEPSEHFVTTFNQLSCPNIENTFDKINYYPSQGYSICCGPLVFNPATYKNEPKVFFESIDQVLNSPIYKVLSKLKKTFTKMRSKSDCNSCKTFFQSELLNNYLIDILNEDPWKNFYPIEHFGTKALSELDTVFQPKIVFTAPKKSITKPDWPINIHPRFTIQSTDHAGESGRLDFLNFCKSTFYDQYRQWYHPSDFERLREQSVLFFQLPHVYYRIMYEDRTVAMLAVCELPNHSLFNETVWHIGYWGIDQSILDPGERKSFRDSWRAVLADLNLKHRVVSNVDFFNEPAQRMAASIGFNKFGYRLDPR